MATLETPARIRDLQRALYRRAKQEPHFRAYALYDKVYRPDILAHAYALRESERRRAGPGRRSPLRRLKRTGGSVLLEELRDALKTKTYRPGPVRRVYIPKLNGGERPLGIPNIRDRVVQTAVKLLLEPLFEADFEPDSYGFRPRRAAHDALDAIREALRGGDVLGHRCGCHRLLRHDSARPADEDGGATGRRRRDARVGEAVSGGAHHRRP